MKKLLKILFTLWPVLCSAQLREVDKQSLYDVNIVKNPGFENGLAQWTPSGGTFASVTSGANLGFGYNSASWLPSGSQTLKSALVAIPNGLLGNTECTASVFYKGSDANMTFKVVNQSNATIAGATTLSAASNYTPIQLSFTCPTSGSLQLVFTASPGAVIIYLDQAFLGFGPGDGLFSGSILPSVNNTYDIGSSSLKWANFYGVTGNFQGVVLSNPSSSTISANNNTSAVLICGGASIGSGALLKLFGPSHASAANVFQLQDATTSYIRGNGDSTLTFGDTTMTALTAVTPSLIQTSTNTGTVTFETKNTNAGAGAQAAQQITPGANNAYAFNLYRPNNATINWFAGTLGTNTTYQINYGGSSGVATLSTPLFTLTSTGLATFAGQLIGKGTATNDSAAAGVIGEIFIQSRLRSAAASLSTGTASNVTGTPLSVTAGDWDIDAVVGFLPGAASSVTNLQMAISATSATLPANDTIAVSNSSCEIRNVENFSANVLGSDTVLTIPKYRCSLSGSTTLYLVAQSTFTISTNTVYGQMFARRAR